jgi:hypothetical protein
MLPLLCNQFSQEGVVEVEAWKRNVELQIKI